MLQKLYDLRKSKKGFTLVELIVVLVILAILAALLVPALTGYIDKAKQKKVVAETRQCVMAAQTLYDEAYGKDGTDAAPGADAIESLAEVNGEVSEVAVNENVISKLKYTDASGKSCTYTRANKAAQGAYN